MLNLTSMKKIWILLFTAAFSLPGLAREWKNPCRGKKNIQADLVAVTGAPGAEMVDLKLKDGQTIRVPLVNLTAPDKAYVEQVRSTLTQAKP